MYVSFPSPSKISIFTDSFLTSLKCLKLQTGHIHLKMVALKSAPFDQNMVCSLESRVAYHKSTLKWWHLFEEGAYCKVGNYLTQIIMVTLVMGCRDVVASWLVRLTPD